MFQQKKTCTNCRKSLYYDLKLRTFCVSFSALAVSVVLNLRLIHCTEQLKELVFLSGEYSSAAVAGTKGSVDKDFYKERPGCNRKNEMTIRTLLKML